MSDLSLSFASQDYPHTRPLFDGRVPIPGIQLTPVELLPHDTFPRMFRSEAFDTCEMALTLYLTALDHGDARFIAIPVYPARSFRHSAIFVRKDGDVREPRDLIGKRVGELHFYGSGPGVWARGILSNEYGVPSDSCTYALGGIGRPSDPPDWLPAPAPATVDITHIGQRTLDDMLERGDIDAIFASLPPAGLRKQPPTVRRLFENYVQVERVWYAKTRIFPILHVLVIRRDVYEQNKWLARALYDGFTKAKDLALAAGAMTLPWPSETTPGVVSLMGADWWPYGISTNRHALETLARYHYEQGLSRRQIAVEELFAPETLSD
jgi:4,5-dihydroxyphthalate decarboxylase